MSVYYPGIKLVYFVETLSQGEISESTSVAETKKMKHETGGIRLNV